VLQGKEKFVIPAIRMGAGTQVSFSRKGGGGKAPLRGRMILELGKFLIILSHSEGPSKGLFISNRRVSISWVNEGKDASAEPFQATILGRTISYREGT